MTDERRHAVYLKDIRQRRSVGTSSVIIIIGHMKKFTNNCQERPKALHAKKKIIGCLISYSCN